MRPLRPALPAAAASLVALALALAVALARPTPARADGPAPEAASGMSASESVSLVDPRSLSNDWMIMPARAATLGGQVTFLTADGGLGTGPVRFTDVVLVGLTGRAAIRGKGEVFGALRLLPKQPSFTDESVFQSGTFGGRVGFRKRCAAWARFGGGPLLDDAGFWGAFDLGVEARKSLDRTLVLQGTLGGAATTLVFDPDTVEPFLVAEVVADGEIIFRSPTGEVAFWLATQFRFPVASNPDPDAPDPGTGGFLDPQTRVNFRVGMVLAYVKDWDLYAEYAYLDRGDLSAPATTLPVLEGGFDQRTLVFGLTRRFQLKERGGRQPKLFLAH